MCFICGSRHNVELHHIFGASNRKKSDKEALTIYLCEDCHRTGRDSAHQSGKTSQLLHAIGELMWLYEHPSKNIRDFIKQYGRNYLKDYEAVQDE